MKTKTLNHKIYFSLKGIITFIVFAGLLASCKEEVKTEADEIREQITVYKEQIVDLNQKVSNLETQLEALGETTHNRVRIPVTVTNMAHEPFDHYFLVNAKVEAVREAMISPEINGQIMEILVSKGQKVTRGQVLARLNTSVTESNMTELKTSMQLAQTVYNRQARLWEQEIGSEIQYLESKNNYEALQSRIKTLEAQLEMAVLRAPINGVVDDIFAKQGEMAMPGAILMQIINLDQLYVNADVSESFLPMVRPNDRVILRFSAFPEYEEIVPIHRLGNVINPDNRTFRLQLRINNVQDRFKPNMVASMAIRSYSTDEALVVPSIMIKQDIQGHYVFLAEENPDGDLIANKVYIERGLSGEGNTMILSGIKVGDQLITQGHNRVSDGSLINVTQERSLAERN